MPRRVHDDASSLAQACAAGLVDYLTAKTAGRDASDPVELAVAGGFVATSVLAAVPKSSALDWSRVRVWWVDERFVASGSPDRNDREALAALFSDLTLRGLRLCPMPADEGQGVAAARDAYAELWKQSMTGRTLDLALLGIGPDGHFASLFPGHPQLDMVGDVLIEANSPKPPPVRLTLSLPVVTSAKKIWVATAGAAKAQALREVFEPGVAAQEVPASALVGPHTTWWIDRAAASLLRVN